MTISFLLIVIVSLNRFNTQADAENLSENDQVTLVEVVANTTENCTEVCANATHLEQASLHSSQIFSKIFNYLMVSFKCV